MGLADSYSQGLFLCKREGVLKVLKELYLKMSRTYT